ncbi:hypothetical protein LSTR_LSTR001187 [Laodelphax striatellus]|uniref:ITPR-interacting domain-containing protein n=1 Tax=Laodelphax striatellus TaxID=195883 RepID=A0A482X252_LAOST|nr:hypothetical protein LSTR_LSTR001187 [Laodelphax striatellus]
MSAGYSASSEADSGGGGGGGGNARRPCQLALSFDHGSLDQQPIGGGDECSLPLLVIDSPTNTNHGSATLLCTPSPSPSPRNKSPVTVQEWVDSLPLTPVEPTRPDDEHVEPATALPANLNETDDILTLGAEAGLLCAGPVSTTFPSVQVTTFGGPAYTADTGRIPARFLQPSKLKGGAIDDFLRHQQDLVHNFESGYWGYRGLAGPSHTIPSVIVAKIMEKLREHERENSVASPPPQQSPHFTHHRATPHQTPNNNNNNNTDNKFSRVAHNLLTKIRYAFNKSRTVESEAGRHVLCTSTPRHVFNSLYMSVTGQTLCMVGGPKRMPRRRDTAQRSNARCASSSELKTCNSLCHSHVPTARTLTLCSLTCIQIVELLLATR